MLHSIREMRNKFAHDVGPLTLESNEVKAKAAGFEFLDTYNYFRRKNARDVFISACEFALGGLYTIRIYKQRLARPLEEDDAQGDAERADSPR